VLLDDGSTQESADGGSAGGRRDRLRLALLASAVGLVLLLVAALYLGFQLRSQAQDEAAQRDALARRGSPP
jgi:type VI protein secretion system component VasF